MWCDAERTKNMAGIPGLEALTKERDALDAVTDDGKQVADLKADIAALKVELQDLTEDRDQLAEDNASLAEELKKLQATDEVDDGEGGKA